MIIRYLDPWGYRPNIQAHQFENIQKTTLHLGLFCRPGNLHGPVYRKHCNSWFSLVNAVWKALPERKND